MNDNQFAALDETFFAVTDGLFSRGFTALAESLLATHDNEVELNAAVARHPSARRRF